MRTLRWGGQRFASQADDFYPAGRVVEAGGIIGVGSDYPVATTFPSFAPLDNVEMFVRRARAGDPDAPMQGHEKDKVSLEHYPIFSLT